MDFINSAEFDTVWSMAKPIKVVLTDSKEEVAIDCTTKEATVAAINDALSTTLKNYTVKGYKIEVNKVNMFKALREHKRSFGLFPNVLKIIIEKNNSSKK